MDTGSPSRVVASKAEKLSLGEGVETG